MRYLIFIFCCFAVSLNAIDLINEGFDSTPIFPTGWTAQGPQPTAWSVPGSNFAGGSPGELKLYFSPGGEGIYRFISPALDTRRVNDMTLSFRHMLDDYASSSETYSLQMQISSDLLNWTTIWSLSAGLEDIPASQVSVPVSYSLGQSETTYLAVAFVGNNYFLDNWYVDDILLSHSSYVGVGIWPSGTYQFYGDLVVPAGSGLTLYPGCNLLFAEGTSFLVEGNLQSQGFPTMPVTLSSLSPDSNWYGLKFINNGSTQDSSRVSHTYIQYSNDSGLKIISSNKIRFSNCFIYANSGYSGGGIYMQNTDAIIENSNVWQSYSLFYGSALYGTNLTGSLSNNVFRGNSNYEGSSVWLDSCNLEGFRDNSIVMNESYGANIFALKLFDCYGVMRSQLIANNGMEGVSVQGTQGTGPTLQNCLIVNNFLTGLRNQGKVKLNSCVIWGNGISIQNYFSDLTIKHCNLQGGQSGITGTEVPSQYYISNIDADPLFVNPTEGQGPSYNPLTADWHLQSLSPCIDAGDPELPLDEDLSVVDIGMYSLAYRPVITRLADVTPDQGHQLDLVWNRCPVDASFQPQAIYSIWRQDAARADTRWLDNPLELNSDLHSSIENLAWRDGNRIWYYITQVPAMNFSQYGLIVPTIQDSSATGLHEVEYTVIYHAPERWWQAIANTAYSVDNIPPLPAGNPLLQRLNGNLFNLSWDEVTEGIWAGNSYPELNQLTYKVYGTDDPDFVPGPGNLIGTTTDPFMVIDSGVEKRFFRILVSDSEEGL